MGIILTRQRRVVERHVQENGGAILHEYLDAGHEGEFPELWQALATARRNEADLVIPSLSALYGCGKFVDALAASEVQLTVVDNPMVTNSTLKVLLAAAQYQTSVRSRRAKQSLKEAKDRGVKLGSARPGHWRGKKRLRERILRDARQRSAEVRRANALAANSTAIKKALRYKALNMNATQIARQLNSDGILTRRGKQWTCIQVQRLLSHAEKGRGAAGSGRQASNGRN